MFAKIFTQIFDSSIAEDYQVRLVFEDMLKLADVDGVVDMTPEAISRRTNVPLELVRKGIAELEKPDPRSRSSEHEGRRLAKLDGHRDWGWIITNYRRYRDIASEEQRRAKTRERVKKFRDSKEVKAHGNAPVTPCNAPVTLGNDFPSASASALIIPENLRTPEFEKAWAEWKNYRKQSRKRMAPSTQQKQLTALALMGVAGAVQSITASIQNGWQGLFPPKDNQPASPTLFAGASQPPQAEDVPTFATVRQGTFRSELESMLADAKAQRAALLKSATLSEEYLDDSDPFAGRKRRLTAIGKRHDVAWRGRISEIEKALRGAK